MPNIIIDIIRYMLAEWHFLSYDLTDSFIEYIRILFVSIGWIGGLITWIWWKENHKTKIPARA